MKNVKNVLKTDIWANLMIFGLLAILTVVGPNSVFGQRDFSALTRGADVPYKNLSEECRQYRLTITTGDVEGAEQDGSVFVTIKGNRGSTDRIDTTANPSLRGDNQNPNGDCRDLNTGTPATFVTWGDSEQVVKSFQFTPYKPFQRNTKSVVTIYAYDVGQVESITLEQDNWYPNWFVRKLELSGGDTIINREVNRWFRSDTLTQTFPVNPNPKLVDYQIGIYTGDVYQGGTNSNVYLLLNSYGGHIITQLDLAKMIPGNPFERNQTDSTGLYDRAPITDLTSITVSVPMGSRWFLGNITINGPYFENRQYSYNNWVEGGKPVTLYADGMNSWTTKITYRNEGFYNALMIVTYMRKDRNGIPIPHSVATSDMPIGQNSVLEVPYDAQDLKVYLKGFGTVKNDVYVSDFVGRPSGDPCFKSWGSTLSPQGGTCDGKPVAIVKPYTAPTLESIKPLTAEQNEQVCFDIATKYLPAGYQRLDDGNVRKLCQGTKSPFDTLDCFYKRFKTISQDNAIAECSGQIPLGSSKPLPPPSAPTNLNILGGNGTSPVPTVSPNPNSQSPNLEGSWVMYNDKGVKFDKFAKIIQRGSNLSLNNGYGADSTGVLTGNSLKTSDGLTGTVSPDGTRINWDINYVWVKQVSTPATNPTPVSTPSSTGSANSAKTLGTARDVDAKNGVVWAIGTNAVPGGYGIYKLNGSSWTQTDGGAVRIAIDQTGNPWVINSEGTIFRRINDVWTVIPGMTDAPAADIAITRNGDVWIVTTRGSVSRWTGSGWTTGRALSAKQVIALPNSDTIQAVEQSGKRWTRESETSWIIASDPTGLADKYFEFAVDSDGSQWVIDSSFNLRKLGGGQSQPNNIVAETQLQPASPTTNATSPTKRSVTFRNESGFVAKMMVQYYEAGPGGMPLPKFLFTDNIPAGQNRTLEIPNSAPNMQITVGLIGTGTMKDNFYSITLDGGFSGNRCYKAWGTLFSPQGGSCQ